MEWSKSSWTSRNNISWTKKVNVFFMKFTNFLVHELLVRERQILRFMKFMNFHQKLLNFFAGGVIMRTSKYSIVWNSWTFIKSYWTFSQGEWLWGLVSIVSIQTIDVRMSSAKASFWYPSKTDTQNNYWTLTSKYDLDLD